MKTTCAILACLAVVHVASAQGAYITADPTDRYSPGSLLVNPALALGGQQIVFGIKAHQMNAAGPALRLRTLFTTVSTPPLLPTGSLLSLEMFDTGMYRRTRLQGGYAWSPLRDLDLGASLGLYHVRYANFRGEELDPDDPLLSSPSKATATLNLGARYRWRNLVLGLGLEDLNRPDVALGSGSTRLPIRYNLGLGVELGALVPYLQVSNRNTWLENSGLFGEDAQIALGLRWELGGQGSVGGGYQDRAPSLAGAVNATSNLQVHARYETAPRELADFSHGSTTVAVMLDQVRHHDLLPPPLAPLPRPGGLPLGVFKGMESQDRREFFILSPISQLSIIQAEVTRTFDFEHLKDLNIQSLPIWTLIPHDIAGGMAEVGAVLPDSLASVPITMRQAGLELPDQWGFSSQYYAEMMNTRLAMDKEQTPVGVVALSGDALDQSLVLRDLMESPRQDVEMQLLLDPRGRVPVDNLHGILERLKRETRHYFNHREYRLWIIPIHMQDYSGAWRVEIRDEVGSVVKQWSGTGLPPDHVSWDWRLGQGDYLRPGDYLVEMQYELDGATRRTRPQYLQVDLRKRSKSLNISNHPPQVQQKIESKTFFLGLDTRPGESQNQAGAQ